MIQAPLHEWRPLLSGSERDAALAAIRAIADVAADAIQAWGREKADRAGINTISLACGQAGVALFYAYCAAADVAPGADAVAIELLEQAIEGMSQRPAESSLYCGFAGVGWATEHIMRMSGAAGEDEDPNAEIDAVLQEHLSEPRPDAEYDLIDGLSGLGVYALERLPRQSGAKLLEQVIERLAELARAESVGAAWPTPARRYAAHQLAPGSQGDFNVGVAHGVPGVLALLGHALEAGVAVERAGPLLERGIEWLLSQRLSPGSLSSFPSYVGAEIESEPARCAWCYGDPGVAAAMLCAAGRSGRSTWRSAALAVAQHAAAQREERHDVRDVGLCHGAAGVGHIFNRMYQSSGVEELAEAARYWLAVTLARRGQQGLAGFQTWSLERTLEGEWIDDPRFLTGVSGTGLALLAATTPIAPDWDRVMLVDAPISPDRSLQPEH